MGKHLQAHMKDSLTDLTVYPTWNDVMTAKLTLKAPDVGQIAVLLHSVRVSKTQTSTSIQTADSFVIR